MFSRLIVAVAIVASGVGPVHAQEPETREEALRREREAKSKALNPPEPSGFERLLLKVENGRLFERLLSPPEGFYPRIGHVTPGSGFSLGPAYRRAALFGERAELTASAIGSLKKYWLVEAKVAAPALAGGALFAEAYARRFDFPQEAFFGIGPSARRSDESRYQFANTVAGGTAGIRPRTWLSVGGRVERLAPRVDRGSGPGGALQDRFSPAQIAGLLEQPEFNRYEAFLDVNYREPRGNPRSGGRYLVSYSMYDDRDLARYDFRRIDIDVQQYVPMFQQRRVIALRAKTSRSDADAGRQVPFYFQQTLGGPDDLRGFRQYRFRDRNLLLLQAEYRWEVFTAMDAAIFYDAGKVTATRDDVDLRGLEHDYGIGVRFGSDNGVFLRVEGAFGSRDGKHLVLRFGNVF
jgi:Omp85 superfamily domain